MYCLSEFSLKILTCFLSQKANSITNFRAKQLTKLYDLKVQFDYFFLSVNHHLDVYYH